jgi:hypothetical protein
MAMRTDCTFVFSAAKRDKREKRTQTAFYLARGEQQLVSDQPPVKLLWRKKKQCSVFSYSHNTDIVTLSAAWNYQMTHVNLVTRLQNIIYTLQHYLFLIMILNGYARVARSFVLQKNSVDKRTWRINAHDIFTFY